MYTCGAFEDVHRAKGRFNILRAKSFEGEVVVAVLEVAAEDVLGKASRSVQTHHGLVVVDAE